MGGLALVGTLSIGADPAVADAAWREAAPEFVDPPDDALPAEPDAWSGAVEGEATPRA